MTLSGIDLMNRINAQYSILSVDALDNKAIILPVNVLLP